MGNLTTATLDIRTGRPAGARTRRSGAAPRSRWAAPCPSHTIATRGILIGRLDGARTRRSGAAPTRRWGASRSVAIEHPAPDTNVYDCDAGYHDCMHCLVESWSPQTIAYCCKNFHTCCKSEELE